MLAKKDRRIVGIDLGTTNSVIAVLNEGRPTVLTTKSGSKMVSSIVHIGEKEVIVGDEARPYLRSDPKNTIFASKRLIGRKYADPAIQEYLSKLPYETVASCNGDVWIKTDFGKFSPAQIGAKILSKMKKIGEEYFGEAIKRAVITVPAYFDDCQKQATRDAGRIAGLDVIRIINEPTAAALAYGLDKKEKGHVAVYDLGGGTFDISILELSDGVFHVKATNGHTFLGGEDFDNAIAKFIAGQFEQEEGVKIKTSEGLQKIKRAAEEAKKKLTNQDETRVYIENVENGYDLDIKLSREQVEAVVMKIVQKTIELCRKAIADAKITTDEIKSVVLVGGMTRMPLVRNVVKEIFKQDPITSVNPDEAVGMGAAVQGGILGGTVGNVLLLDVAPLSLGIEVAGGVFSRIVDRNTTLPFRRTETFTTSMDNQEYVDIRVYQGERQLVKDNRYLGCIRLVNLPRAPRGVPKIDVTFEADVNGITKVTAQDSLTKKKQEIQITPSGGLSEEEIQRMIEDAEKNAEEDAKNLELAEFKAKALQLIEDYEGRNVPTDLKKKVDELKSLLHSDIEKAKSLLENMKKRL